MRFWDGRNWTNQTAPAAPQPKPTSTGRGILIVFGGIIAALVVALGFYWLATPSDLDCSVQRLEVTTGERASWELHDACR